MPIGQVKWYDAAQRGFGFITADDGKDVFVHSSAVVDAGLAVLNTGSRVSYEVAADGHRRCAINLRIVPGSNLEVMLPAGRVKGTFQEFDMSRGRGLIAPEQGDPVMVYLDTVYQARIDPFEDGLTILFEYGDHCGRIAAVNLERVQA